jgi:hypothetical protein
MNARHKDQRLRGYRTLNLLNAHADPSFLREVLFSHIAGHYLPNYQVNFVRVVINGESWGVFVNAQQFNSDFTKQFFGSRSGARWKIPPSRDGGAGTLAYAGDDASNYPGIQLKTPEVMDAWDNLIELCRRLEQTPIDQLDTDLDEVLNVDRALWFLALDNLLIDGDGYLSRASDYTLYQDVHRRFHTLHYDSNETFRHAGGGGPGVRLPTAPGSGAFLDPFVYATPDTRDLADRPLVQRLLENSRLRMRYTAHVRTILNDWISWDVVGPVVDELVELIDENIKSDTRKLYSYEQFAEGGGGERGGPTLRDFIDQRQIYLCTHEELTKEHPSIESVVAQLPEGGASALKPVQINAKVQSDVGIDQVILYVSAGRELPYEQLEMVQEDTDTYVGEIPAFPAGTRVRFYVEARSAAEHGTTVFHPTNTEKGALSYRVEARRAPMTTVVINEILASSKMTAKDPQGQFEDYIELMNLGKVDADLSGYYLTDNPKNPRKWMFPADTIIPAGGYLVVWADEDRAADQGLHANFKLAKAGETVMLVDMDERHNQVLDEVKFENLRADVAYGRLPDGTGAFSVMHGSAGASNR